MEARSLTALNELAAHPPQYPKRPIDERQDPLTLYISRVPGTRDVILSPFKPQEKNVTGEDVASSLYYVHLEMANDDLTASGCVDECNPHRSSEESSSSHLAIPRKPLPGSVRPLTPDSLPSGNQPAVVGDASLSLSTKVAEAGQDIHEQVAQAAGLTPLPTEVAIPQPSTDKDGPLGRTSLLRGMPARKPLSPGALPIDVPNPNAGADGLESTSNPPPISPLDIYFSQDNPNSQRNPVRPQPSSQTHSRSPSPHKRASALAHPTGTPFTLTLIRRDPSTGNQWNVGRISSRQLDHLDIMDKDVPLLPVVPPIVTTSPHAHPPIDVEIETSGYAKFRNMPFKKSNLPDGGLDGALAAMANRNRGERSRNCREVGVFSRQMAMEYSKSWATNFRGKLHRMEQVSRSKIDRYRNDGPNLVNSSIIDPPPEMPVDTVITNGPPPPGMKARGYTFDSPWDGKCEFRTGTAGRSLQCRHIPHHALTANPGSHNPLIPDPNNPGVLRPAGQIVSELRFNLPSSEILAEHAKTSTEQWRGNFSKLLKPNSHNEDEADGGDDDDEAVSPFDINLGSERAGGGNRGRRAKLGKLIIYDDGLKMLDLLVAANMGIWWGAWEKNF